MTKRNYIQFADMLRRERETMLASSVGKMYTDAVLQSIENRMVTIFSADNAKFDASRFRDAAKAR